MSKITLAVASDIALDKFVASDANVRRIKAGVSVEDLAEDIARRGLLQSLSVRPFVDGDGAETGKYTVTAGGRRLAALKLLVKQKRLAKNAPVPCIVKTNGVEEEDSLAENTMREALHPLDQFRAFKNLHEQGLSIDDIAARFFVGAQVVRQRLKLAAASSKLLDLYVAEELSLDQLMAFCVTDDHARQEEVWEALSRSYDKGPYAIRRQLTQGAVRASDKRAQFVGVEAYEAAGGVVLRDLFNRDDGGWLQDAALLDRLAREKLERAAEEIRAEGWKWSETAIDFPYGHTTGLRRLPGTQAPITEEEQARYDAAVAEYNRLSEEHESADELPEDADQRMAELETEIASIDERPSIYDRAEIARAGVFVSIDHDGRLKVERGFVRPEDEARKEGGAWPLRESRDPAPNRAPTAPWWAPTRRRAPSRRSRPRKRSRPRQNSLASWSSSSRLIAPWRCAWLGQQSAGRVSRRDACSGAERFLWRELPLLSRSLRAQRHARLARSGHWRQSRGADLVRVVRQLADASARRSGRSLVLASCSGRERSRRTLRPVRRAQRQCPEHALGETNQRASARRSTRRTYRARHARLLERHRGELLRQGHQGAHLAAVREAKGDETAEMIAHLKKADMAAEAERLLQGTGWLPEGLRTPNLDAPAPIKEAGAPADDPSTAQDEEMPAFLEEATEGPDYPAAAE